MVLGKQKAKLRKGLIGLQERREGGKKILVDGKVPDSDPLIQAVAGARSVQAILETRTGKRFDVKPIVVFLGWYTARNPGSAPAWVLSAGKTPRPRNRRAPGLKGRIRPLLTEPHKKILKSTRQTVVGFVCYAIYVVEGNR